MVVVRSMQPAYPRFQARRCTTELSHMLQTDSFRREGGREGGKEREGKGREGKGREGEVGAYRCGVVRDLTLGLGVDADHLTLVPDLVN